MSTDNGETHADFKTVTWPIWLAWVGVAALIALTTHAFGAALTSDWPANSSPQQKLLYALFFGSAVLLFPTLVLAQGFILRRILPKLSVGFWLACVVLSALVGAALTNQSYLRTARSAWLAATRFHGPETIGIAQIAGLPLAALLFWTIAFAAVPAALPAWALGSISGFRRGTLIFFAAALVGACVGEIVDGVYFSASYKATHVPVPIYTSSWTEIFEQLAFRAGVGASWGAATAMVVILATHRAIAPFSRTAAIRRGTVATIILMSPVFVALLGPFASYLAGPRGFVIGAPELWRALSLAPSKDRSTGEALLTPTASIPVTRYYAPDIAPDQRSVIVRRPDHQLILVDIATGQSLRPLSDPLAPSEQYVIAWSPDGRYLALQRAIQELPIRRGAEDQFQSRLILYTLPALEPVAEYTTEKAKQLCLQRNGRAPMVFSADSRSIWLACGGRSGKPPLDDPLAIRVDVPPMQLAQTRLHGATDRYSSAATFARVGGSVWLGQFSGDDRSYHIRDLTDDRDIATLPIPPDLVAGMTRQRADLKAGEVDLLFCGNAPDRPDMGPASWICRTLTFEVRSGALLSSRDRPDERFAKMRPDAPKNVVTDHGLRIESYWREDSKTGELVVRDDRTGRERQRMTTIATRLMKMTSDGRWLVTNGLYENVLRLYRIDR